MQNNKDNQQQSGSEQNPTLDKPGSQVADYGNTTGGSANISQQDQSKSDQQRESTSIPLRNDETIGNP